ncbi:MAG: hypothetical protein WC582_01650 [Patescibacteria group bacterium]
MLRILLFFLENNGKNKFLKLISITNCVLVAIFLATFFVIKPVNAATEFVSAIQQSGGDYASLASWQTAVASDLTASTTVVYSGAVTGTLTKGNVLELFRGGVYQNATSTLVAKTSTQALVRDYYNGGASIVLQSGDQWRVASSTSNMFTISGSGLGLGDTPIATAKISGSWTNPETGTLNITGWTTNSSHYIRIYTDSTGRQAGVWDDTKYRLSSTNANVLNIYEDFVRVDGLQIQMIATNTYRYGVEVQPGDGAEIQISNCIIRGNLSDTANNINGVMLKYYADGTRTLKIWNNIIYNWINGENTIGGLWFNSSWISYAYNNTVYNNGIGLRLALGDTYLKNNISYNNNDNYNGTFFNTNSTNNLSGPSQSDAPGLVPINNAVVATSTEGFHLISSDTSAKNAGVSLVSDPDGGISFTTDIDGDIRDSSWDVGVDEVMNSTPNIPASLSPASLVNGSNIATTTPYFTFTLSDTDGADTLRYRIQIATSSNFANIETDYVSALAIQGTATFVLGQAAGSGYYLIGSAGQTFSDADYYWRVSTTDNSNATSTYATANSGGIAFKIDNTAPSGVEVPTFGTVTSSSIIVNKSDATETGTSLNQWQVKRDSTELGLVATTTTSVTDSSLSQNTQYTYSIQFTDAVDNASSYGTTAQKYTLADTPTNLAGSLSGSGNTQTITLTVDSFSNASSGLSGYYFSNTTNSTNSGWITTNTWQEINMLCGKTYSYTVKYRNGEGIETNTASFSQTTVACSGGIPFHLLQLINNANLVRNIILPTVENKPEINMPESQLKNEMPTDKVVDPQIENYKVEASIIFTADVESLTSLVNKQRNIDLEIDVMNSYLREIGAIAESKEDAFSAYWQLMVLNFISYGTPSTQDLGMGERAGVINSFRQAFNKLPNTKEEWIDVVKIGNGRWPGTINPQAEERAKINFNIVYKRDPDNNNSHDNAAITVMAYGLRPSQRNLNSEKQAIKIFKNIYGYYPEKPTAWDVVRAIAYSGATR